MRAPIVVRGGGDIATGTIYRLCKSGYPVVVLECPNPTAIRRKVSFCEALYLGSMEVEGMTCVLADTPREALLRLQNQDCQQREPVLLVDEKAECIDFFKPEIVVDAILAKKNLGTNRSMADRTIALGPGFCAGRDVDFVIETMRGHDLGRIIQEGCALADTGVPGPICGVGKERVIHAPGAGVWKKQVHIADLVEKGQILGYIQKGAQRTEVQACVSGVLRGILRDGFPVCEGLKMADIDPRTEEKKNCFTISDKARCIAGSVLELVSAWSNGGERT